MVTIFNNKYNKYWYHSLRWKLFISFLAISVLPMLFLANTISKNLENHFSDASKKKYVGSANIIASSISKGNFMVDETLKNYFKGLVDDKSKEGLFRILVVDTMSVVIQDSNETEIGKTYVVSEILDALDKNDTSQLHRKQEAIYAAAPILKGDSEVVGAVLIIASVNEDYVFLNIIRNSVLVLTFFMTAIIAIIVFFISQIIIDPVRNFLNVVKKMSEGQLNQRINFKGHDEFYELGIAFNNMSEKLERVEKTREEFVSNVSHELKTPLSSIKVLTQAILIQENVPIEIYTDFLKDIDSEIDRMTNIVNDLLTLVRLDQREIIINFKTTNLNNMVGDILKRLYPLAEQKDIELRIENIKKVTIDADEMKLVLAISNLVENAIKYTDNEGTVKVIIDADHQNSFITVQDTGVGISEEEQSKIFNRFYRVDKTRDRETGGTGLGLSITLSTIILHNGSIKILSKENEGASFLVRIPIHQQKEQQKD